MLTEILRRYKDYDPATGRFDSPRSLRAYGRLIGIHNATLSQILNGYYEPSRAVLQALARTFPAAAIEIASALAQPDAEPVEVAS